MNISSFDDLLQAAREQTDPQRLLMVFVAATLPDDATGEQRASFEAGDGGELEPMMCVDKDPLTLTGFDALAREAASMAQPWVLVFAAALAGQGGRPPGQAQVQAALQEMVEAVRAGDVGNYIPFDRQGYSVDLV